MCNLWDDEYLHHQFQLVERESRMVLEDSIEIHTVELAKYNGGASEVHVASILEQWAYWIKNAGEHSVEELRELLPGLEFLRATREMNAIRNITMERIDPTYEDTPTHSVAIAPMSSLLVINSEVGDPLPSTTTSIGLLTRDPFGFFDGENLYTARMLLARLDPSGIICFDEKKPCSDADGKGGLDPNTEKVYHLCMAICKSTLPIKNPLDVCKHCKKLPPLARPMCDYLCKETKKNTPLNDIPDPKDFFCDKVCCSGKLPDGVPGDECIPEFLQGKN